MHLDQKLKAYYLTAILSMVIAMAGFTYNTWRLEVSETNNTVRTASFEVLKLLAEIEQQIYLLHYDMDPVNGNPRKIWVDIGLVVDLSPLVGSRVNANAETLHASWSQHWQQVANDNQVTEDLIDDIDAVRFSLKNTLDSLS